MKLNLNIISGLFVGSSYMKLNLNIFAGLSYIRIDLATSYCHLLVLCKSVSLLSSLS